MRKKEQMRSMHFIRPEWLMVLGNLFNLSGQVALFPLDGRSDRDIICTDWMHLYNDFARSAAFYQKDAATCHQTTLNPHQNTLNYA